MRTAQRPPDAYPAPTEPPAAAGVSALLSLRARQFGDKPAYIFLKDGENESGRLSYQALEQACAALAAHIAAHAAPGTRVLLLYPSGLDFIVALLACMRAGMVAVPAAPSMRRPRDRARLRCLAADAGVGLVLTLAPLAAEAASVVQVDGGAPPVLASDAIPAGAGGSAPPVQDSDASVVLLQYTSGATGDPKGVMVSNHNILENLRLMQQAFALDAGTVFVSWLPLHHDQGLFGTVLLALYLGATAVLMSPVSFLQAPLRWLRAISAYRASTSGGPNFAYQLCVDKIGAEQRAGLDLRCWRVAYNGAEPVRARTLDAFNAAFRTHGLGEHVFCPAYGLAEATLLVCASVNHVERLRVARAALVEGRAEPAAEQPARELVGCGAPLPGWKLAIVESERAARLPEDRVGEIWLSGPCVSAGYWGRGGAAHGARLGGSGDAWLRTGDLGFLHEGQLYIVGRSKNTLILRGQNHYASDLDQSLGDCHPALQIGGAAVVAIDDGDEERLLVVHEVRREHLARVDLAEVAQAMARVLAEQHGIDDATLALVRPGTVPRTTSGKVLHHVCGSDYEDGRLALLGPVIRAAGGTTAQPAGPHAAGQAIRAYVGALAGIEPSLLDGGVRLADLGLDSLAVTGLGHELAARCGVRLSFAELYMGSLDELARLALSRNVSAAPAPVAAPARFALAESQRGMYVLSEAGGAQGAYRLAYAMALDGLDSPEPVRAACAALVARHPSLRMRVCSHGGMPLQEEGPARLDFAVETVAAGGLAQRLRSETARPFALAQDAPFRVRLFELAPGRHAMMWTLHHLFADHWSCALLLEEFCAALQASLNGQPWQVAPPRAHYAELAQWQDAQLHGAAGAQGLAYFRAALAQAPAPVDLAAHLALAPERRGRAAGSAPFRFDAVLSQRIKARCRNGNATLYAGLLSVFFALLHRYSGQSDLVVGSITAGRTEARFADLVGCCVNTVALRVRAQPGMSFDALLQATRFCVQGALEHQDYPFARLVAALQPERAEARQSLFRSLFVYQHDRPGQGTLATAAALGVEGACRDVGNVRLATMPLAPAAPQADLALVIGEVDGCIRGYFSYDSACFGPEAARLAGHFENLARTLADAPQQRLGAAAMLGAAEADTLLRRWQGPRQQPGDAGSLATLFERQAVKAGARIAVSGQDEAGRPLAWTYAELNERANRLAWRLRAAHSIGVDDIVAVQMDRSPHMLCALLAVLKCGAAYLPLDPALPPERAARLLRESGARVLLVDADAPGAPVPARLTPGQPSWQDGAPDNVQRAEPERALAYVIYTSGSTGQPKGVMIEQRSILNRLRWMGSHYAIGAGDVFLQKTSLSFDVSVWELFLPLLHGARLALAPPAAERDPALLLETLRREQVSIVHFVPSMLAAFLQAAPAPLNLPRLRWCICSGEALTRFHAALWQRTVRGGAALHNLYGPTEASIDVSWHAVAPQAALIPIGQAVANTSLHVLDPSGNLLPIGVPGELCLGGVQLGRGYLGQPALSARQFVPHPYADGERLYRSGDQAYWRADGQMVLLGRLDHQVKVRGYRIEPGEIEAALLQHPQVRAAAVTAPAGSDGQRSLEAWVVAEHTDEVALAGHLRGRLPAYMLPARWHLVAQLLYTSSGKVDRAALAGRPRAAATAATQPASPAERIIAAAFGVVLDHPAPGGDDDFFALGGDSIRAIRVIALARESGVGFSLADLFDARTVRALALCAHRVSGLSASAPFGLLDADIVARLPAGLDDAYPLSMLQRILVFNSEHHPDYEIYVTTLHLRARWDHAALQQAAGRLLQRHPFLRASIDLAGHAEPLQLIQHEAALPVTVSDWRELDGQAQDAHLAAWLEQERRRGFDWHSAPLLRLHVHRRSEHTFQLTLSDASLDGWCVATVLTELLQDYDAVLAGRTAPLTVPAGSYRDFVAQERAALADAAAQDYWRGQLAGHAWRALPRWPRPAAQRPSRQRLVLAFDPAAKAALSEAARSCEVPLRSVLLAAHLRVLACIDGSADVLTGLELNGRLEQADGDRVVGVFNNMLPLRYPAHATTWQALIQATFDSERKLMPHRRYPIARLQRQYGSLALFDAVFVYTHFHVYQAVAALEQVEVIESFASDQTYVPLTCHFNLSPDGAALQLLLDYDAGQFAAGQVEMFSEMYRRALARLAADPHERMDAASLLEPNRLQRQLVEWNHSAAPYPRSACLHQLFERQAHASPHALALAAGEQRWTYAALNDRADTIARTLAAAGAGPETRVAVCLGRSGQMVAALLGVLKAGAAYVPLDPAYPRSRLAFMLEDCGAALTLSDAVHAAHLPHGIEVLDVDAILDGATASAGAATPVAHPLPANLAYVIYTSGSTGQPKASAVTHAGLVNYLSWCRGQYAGGPAVLHSSIAFDLSVTSLFVPLLRGDAVHLVPEEDGVEGLCRLLESGQRFGLLKLTPSHLRALRHRIDPATLARAAAQCVVGGENLLADDVCCWREGVPGPEFINEYGPTETVVGCCVHRAGAADDHEPGADGCGDTTVPIGRPIANMRLYVLDGALNPVAPGSFGELYIGGPGVARGYLGRSALTAECFLPDPFGIAGGRLYRTGDRVRQLPDGTLMCSGRLDRQVKLRGYRVELGEVEAALAASAGVQGAAARVVTAASGAQQLLAYVVAGPGVTLDLQALRRSLKQRLPHYMLPDNIMKIDRFSLTVHGKIDYSQLPAVASPEDKRARARAILEQVEQVEQLSRAVGSDQTVL